MQKNCRMAEPEVGGDFVEPCVTADAFLGGRLMLRQPRRGHRAGTDAILLGAAAAPDFEGLVLDIGAGVGAAGLVLAATRPMASIGLVENDPATAALARENLAFNGMAARGRVFEADVLAPKSRRAAGLVDESADLVISNPPFFDPRRARASPDQGRRRAHVMLEGAPHGGRSASGSQIALESQFPPEGDAREGAALAAWVAACLALTRPAGSFIMIHRPDSLGVILQALAGRAGGTMVLPIQARGDEPAIRILLRAKKGGRAPLVIAPALVLHEGGADGFTPLAERIHRGDAAIPW